MVRWYKIHMKDICISIIYDFGMIAFNGTVIIETKRIKNGTKIIYKSLNGSNDRKVSVTKEVNPYRALINFFNKPKSYIYQFQYECHEIINQLNICITGISGWKKNYLMLNLLCEEKENEKSFSRYFESFSEKILDKIFRSKNDLRIICYGEIDELNSIIGGCIAVLNLIKDKTDSFLGLISNLNKIQNELFNLGTMFATLPENMNDKMPQIEEKHIKFLEIEMDKFNKDLLPLKSFVLPGGSQSNVWLHLARTVCRRVERNAVSLSKCEELDANAIIYLNRLSDAFFIYSRWIIKFENKEEYIWNPNNS